jgi:hypothetical protein
MERRGRPDSRWHEPSPRRRLRRQRRRLCAVTELQYREHAPRLLPATIPVGGDPESPSYDSGNGCIYEANFDSDNVSILNGTSQTATVPVGNGPLSTTYDDSNGYVYVVNSDSDNVSVIELSAPARYGLTFTESGLPAGTNGSVTLEGTLSTSTTSTISLVEPNGTYSFQVGAVPGYVAGPGSGSAVVSGGAAWQAITFAAPSTPAFAVTFTESGAPPGTSWSVALNGTPTSSTTSTIAFDESNGTCPFTVGALSGYAPRPSAGNVTVSGEAAGQSIEFSLLPRATYNVTVAETGLTSGTAWSVTLSGVSRSSGTDAIEFNETNGTYAYFVGAVAGHQVAPSAGNITVAGAPRSRAIAFASAGHEPASGFLGLSGNTGYYLLGSIIAVAAAGVTVALIARSRRESG